MTPSNLFHCSKGRGVVHKIAFTGVFLGLVLLLQFLSRYMPFADTYIKLNFSLLFILPIFYYAGPIWGILTLLLRFAMGPVIAGTGYHPRYLTGHFILLVCSIVTIGFMYIYSSIFSKMKSHNIKVITIAITTFISSSLILTFLNQIFFTPLYWVSTGYIKHFSISETIDVYNNPYFLVKAKFFMIPNYWAGTFVTYFAGNLAKYGVIFLCYIPMAKVLRTYASRNNESWG
ncbi:MPN527 family putative ECF transporter permease subunit [Mycoplasma todarodis]|uniref:ECF transporter S component n=1 Tax=Mycoplasma todarodis TaxID=1937191 RepID=A0A4V2NI99_9MOLU|nr:hypothetical protein [Mycoplasma todarodis]TCG11518.1 hypothetical protein C4B25_01495 [Mycoplasma todarodis]